MATERDLTLCGEYTTQYTSDFFYRIVHWKPM